MLRVCCCVLCLCCFLLLLCVYFRPYIHCGSAHRPGASSPRYYCAPPVCVPEFLGELFRQSVDVAKEIVLCSTSSKHCTWAFTPTFEPTSGERTYGELMVACWAELIEKEVGMPDRFICPFILGSDGESTFSCLCTLLCFRCARLGCRAPNFS